MSTKHPAGYWINQLSDEQIEKLAIRILSKNEKFNKIGTIKREESHIIVNYHYEKINAYLRCRESTITISDFSLSGKVHSDCRFYEFMIETLGNEYAEELLEYLEKAIADMNQDISVVKGLINFKNNIEEDLQHHENNI